MTRVLDTPKFNILVEHGKPSLTYKNKACTSPASTCSRARTAP